MRLLPSSGWIATRLRLCSSSAPAGKPGLSTQSRSCRRHRRHLPGAGWSAAGDRTGRRAQPGFLASGNAGAVERPAELYRQPPARSAAAPAFAESSAIEWSYRLLPSLEQAIFAHLGVFAGSFSLEAAQAVCSDLCPLCLPRAEPHQATAAGAEAGTEKHLNALLAVLARLVEHNMLRQSPNPGPQGETRFHLLLTLREYALECLEGGGTTGQVHQLHADYYLHLATEAMPSLAGPQQLTWLHLLENDLENLRALLSTACCSRGSKSPPCACLPGWRVFWEMTGSLAEGRAWLEAALQTGAAASQLEYANGLLAASSLAWWQGDFR